MKLFSVVLAVLIVIYSSFSSASQKFQSVESDRESKELAVSESRPIEKISVSANRNYLNQKTLMALPADTLLVNEQLSPNRSIADWLVQLPGLSLNGQGGLMQSYSLRGLLLIEGQVIQLLLFPLILSLLWLCKKAQVRQSMVQEPSVVW